MIHYHLFICRKSIPISMKGRFGLVPQVSDFFNLSTMNEKTGAVKTKKKSEHILLLFRRIVVPLH